MSQPNPSSREASPPPVKSVSTPWTTEQIQGTLRRAATGDEAAIPELRKMLDYSGADVLGGNLATMATDALLRNFFGNDLLARETVTKKMAELRSELGGKNPSAVERLLAERAACCWLHLYRLELGYGPKSSMSPEVGEYYERCFDRAHKRYLSALKSLAEVRKIGVTLQLNIARKQVNVAGGAGHLTTAK